MSTSTSSTSVISTGIWITWWFVEVASLGGRDPSWGSRRHRGRNLRRNRHRHRHHLVDHYQIEVEGLAGVLDDHGKLEDLDHLVEDHLLKGRPGTPPEPCGTHARYTLCNCW